MIESIEIQRIVAQLQLEVQEFLTENIVGKSSDEKILELTVAFATAHMQRGLPGFTVTVLNPHFEGSNIVLDGWLVIPND